MSKEPPKGETLSCCHNKFASSMCELLQALFPTLSAQDLQLYWSRLLKYENTAKVVKLAAMSRRQQAQRED